MWILPYSTKNIYIKVMQGVRENYYSHEELKEWLKNGKIKEFRR
jgi:hypothetical protein